MPTASDTRMPRLPPLAMPGWPEIRTMGASEVIFHAARKSSSVRAAVSMPVAVYCSHRTTVPPAGISTGAAGASGTSFVRSSESA